MHPDELAELGEQRAEVHARRRYRVGVCASAGCMSTGGDTVLEELRQCTRAGGQQDAVDVFGTGCLGLCDAGPLVAVTGNDGRPSCLYRQVSAADASTIVKEHLQGGQVVARLRCDTNVPFFQRQRKIVLANHGRVDSEEISDYLAAGGYLALAKALTEMAPADVVREMTQSGLRGRGGGGYPTGLKWGTVAKQVAGKKFVICNADEGDPGAFMDRSVLEGDPHRVLEGMAIAGYAVGADQGFIYVRGEYPLAIQRLRLAIKQAEKLQLLGARILSTPFHFRIDLRIGAGAFVCGEETALIGSIEGGRGSPRPRPPFPAEVGLWQCPTLINNVETFANVPPIIENGGAWYAGIGTEGSKGTKVFALAGAITNTGLIEVPMGTSLREIVFDIGGGIPNGKKFKAVQTGGPSGGCIPENHLDLPVDYDSLRKVGSIMGSGGMIVMDESSDMVDVAKFFMEFCMDESCGKCVPCRAGTVQLYNLLAKISVGDATLDDLTLLESLCGMVKDTSLCGLGQTAPNPVLSTLQYFRHEYLEKIGNRRRPARPARLQPLFVSLMPDAGSDSTTTANSATSATTTVQGASS